MLTLRLPGRHYDCEGPTRREFLKIGALGLGGLTLADLLAAQASGASGGGPLKDTSVVMLFLQGGPTHVETFDPKMTAPREYRSMFGEVATKLPGVTFGGTFPKLAELADKLAVVRSFRHGNGSHRSASVLVASGGNPSGANMGSMYARLAGNNNPATGMPTNVLLFPAAIGEKYKKYYRNPDRIGSVGELGSAYKPFDPSAGGQVVKNMELSIPRGRFDDRRELLDSLDSLRRGADATGALSGVDEITRQAYDVILGVPREEEDWTLDPLGNWKQYTQKTLGRAGDLARILPTGSLNCRIPASIGAAAARDRDRAILMNPDQAQRPFP